MKYQFITSTQQYRYDITPTTRVLLPFYSAFQFSCKSVYYVK